mmetsp:Transcript_70356/g.177320  ORF Transcript_70356/g.177320 Transcript_70356/m.177320 type:complete len:503 (-) Transcript_70356:372-1880(-)
MLGASGLIATVAVVMGLPQEVVAHGWATIRTESGDRIESRNSVAWKTGQAGYPNPHGMSQTGSAERPMYCGGVGQHGSQPVHDQVSAPEALTRAKEAGFATTLRKGSKFTLENWITANHGGAAALYYACPADGVSTPGGYKALDWKMLTPLTTSYPESKRNGVAFSEKMPGWYGWAGGICNWQYDGGVIEQCDDCQLAYGGPETVAMWEAQKPPSGAPHAQDPMIVNIEYQLPADFECEHAVFSWMWQTPHLCLPKEVHEKGAELDFWRACQRESFPFAVCATEWEGEIFCNCIDAEVADQTGAAPVPSGTTAPNPMPASSTSSPSPAPPSEATTTTPPNLSSVSHACVPIGACDEAWCNPERHAQWCNVEGSRGSCPTLFCQEQQQQLASSTTKTPPESQPPQWPVPTPAPTEEAPAPAAPAPAHSSACGSCSACLWSNGVCYDDVDENYCMAWNTNRWCGAVASFRQQAREASGRRSFLGTAFVQKTVTTVRASLASEEL